MLQMCGTTNPVQVHKEFQVPEVMKISWCLDGIYGGYVQHDSHSNRRPSNSPWVDMTSPALAISQLIAPMLLMQCQNSP